MVYCLDNFDFPFIFWVLITWKKYLSFSVSRVNSWLRFVSIMDWIFFLIVNYLAFRLTPRFYFFCILFLQLYDRLAGDVPINRSPFLSCLSMLIRCQTFELRQIFLNGVLLSYRAYFRSLWCTFLNFSFQYVGYFVFNFTMLSFQLILVIFE